MNIAVSEWVRNALTDRRPVVALESTIISHGFPRPRNLECALQFEQALIERGVTPATIAVIDGLPIIGLDEAGLHRIAEDHQVLKLSARDLPIAVAQGRTGSTTVAATAYLASRAGIRVFATGGLGGVHRGASETFDESADLVMLSQTAITVVSAGVKSILDIPATLERLETLNVAVLGYQTRNFAGFWLSDSGYELDWRIDTPETIVEIMRASDALGRLAAIVVSNALPHDRQMEPDLHNRILEEGLKLAAARGVRGKDISPFLLSYFAEASGGRSLEVNVTIALNNIALASQIATAWARTHATGAQG